MPPIEPFGGKFRRHRAALARIKAGSWMRAAAHSGETLIGLSGRSPERRISGDAVCRICQHRFNWVAKAGTPLRNFSCPRCGSSAGEIAGPDYGPDDRPASACD
jgi:hypothetical protein